MSSEPDNWFLSYCNERQPELREASRKVYGAWWHQYVASLKGHDMATAQPSHVNAFLQRYSGNTAIRYFRLLRAVYDWAQDVGLCQGNPLDTLSADYQREEERVPLPALSASVIEALYTIKPDSSTKKWKPLRDQALVLLAAEAGLRRRELIDLKTEDLRIATAAPKVTLAAPGKKREVPLTPRLCLKLQQWLDVRGATGVHGDRVFPSKVDGEALDPSTVYRIIERHLSRVGAGKSALGSSGTQVLRASVALKAQQDGRKLSDVQRLLGHRRPMSTVDMLARIEPSDDGIPRLSTLNWIKT